MSTTDDTAAATAAPVLAVADPAPLGLAAFALTTFLLSAANAHWMSSATATRGWAMRSPTAAWAS